MTADPYWNYVKLLCHFDGPNDGRRIVDEKHKPVVLGAAAVLSTLHKKFGEASGYFNGTPGAEIYWLSPLGISPGTEDFTAEGWFYLRDQAPPGNWIFGFGNSDGITANGAVLFADMASNPGKFAVVVSAFSVATPLLVSTSSIVYDQWVHLAVTRINTTWRLSINGVIESSATLTLGDISAPTLRLSHSICPLLGYMDDFRLTVGMGCYTADFTPPTTAFPGSGATDQYYGNVALHCHFDGENNTTTLVDKKGHALTAEGVVPAKISTAWNKFGGSSLLGNVTSGGGRVNCGTSIDYVLGTADFTVEGTVKTDNATPNGRLFEARNASGTEVLSLRLGAGSDFVPSAYLNGSAVIVGGTAISQGVAGAHVALVRSGATLKLFTNGVQNGSTYAIGAASINNDGTLYIGGSPSVGFPHYLDEFRFTNGVARYLNTFTPSAEPFPDYTVQKLTGTVFDADNNPVAKTVRSYRTSDGLLIDQSVSDATTGAFELRATDTTEHFVVVHDATKNALVYDHIVPVI